MPLQNYKTSNSSSFPDTGLRREDVWITACAGMTALPALSANMTQYHSPGYESAVKNRGFLQSSRSATPFLNKYFSIIFLIIVILILSSTRLLAGDYPFTSPNNWGATGLMETPTARVLEPGKYRVGLSQIEPYRYYYGAISPIKGLEVDGRITEVIGVSVDTPNSIWKGYGNEKDKAIDLKYQFISEGKYWPAVALGIMDPHGTRIYTGQYLVMSKQIYPFDFTIGMGNGRFGKQPLSNDAKEFGAEIFENQRQWWSDAQVFGGIEFAASSKLSFMVEYNPIKYEIQTGDPAQAKYFPNAVPSKINFGMRYKPVEWAQIDLSYQRGNQIGLSLSFNFDMGKPFIPIYDLSYTEKSQYKTDPIAGRIIRGLYASGFTDIGIKTLDTEIWVEATNDRYFYNERAIGVMLKVVNQILPAEIKRINLILVERGIPLIALSTEREDLHNFEEDIFKVSEYLTLTEIKTDIYEMPEISRSNKRYFYYGLKPEFQPFLNDPTGFFKFRAGVSGWVALQPWKGASLVAGVEAYAYNNISSVNDPLSIPVRSDSVAYLQRDMALSSLMFEQIGKTKYEIYGKIAAGLLEAEYAGVDSEIATPLFKGRIYTGISGSLVRKRDPANPIKLSDDYTDYYKTAFFNARLNIPELEMALDVKAGRFLAGDKGARITLSKDFNGVVISAWYSVTDTSVFTDTFNNGYHDKGISISIPLRMFLGRDSRTSYEYALSPWTRDVAQDVAHRTSLFDFLGRNTKLYLSKDRDMLQ
jgi:hypothetical protein